MQSCSKEQLLENLEQVMRLICMSQGTGETTDEILDGIADAIVSIWDAHAPPRLWSLSDSGEWRA